MPKQALEASPWVRLAKQVLTSYKLYQIIHAAPKTTGRLQGDALARLARCSAATALMSLVPYPSADSLVILSGPHWPGWRAAATRWRRCCAPQTQPAPGTRGCWPRPPAPQRSRCTPASARRWPGAGSRGCCAGSASAASTGCCHFTLLHALLGSPRNNRHSHTSLCLRTQLRTGGAQCWLGALQLRRWKNIVPQHAMPCVLPSALQSAMLLRTSKRLGKSVHKKKTHSRPQHATAASGSGSQSTEHDPVVPAAAL